MIQVKRTYEARAKTDGQRVLVERLWPRGMTAASLAAELWLKDIAPSTELRKWYGHRVERWKGFRERYRRELDRRRDVWEQILEASRSQTVTLLYSARDTEHNSAVVLREYLLEQHEKRAPSRRRARTEGRNEKQRHSHEANRNAHQPQHP
jgi:uncharacterized protein YeaO (DUF488 family)